MIGSAREKESLTVMSPILYVYPIVEASTAPLLTKVALTRPSSRPAWLRGGSTGVMALTAPVVSTMPFHFSRLRLVCI